MKAIFKITIGLYLVVQASALFAYPGESIVRDANGDYIITYWNGANMMKTKFVPATKIEPSVNSIFKMTDSNLIAYRYTIINGRNARQPIGSIRVRGLTRIFSSQPVIPISSDMSPQAALAAVQSAGAPIVTPNRWNGRTSPDPTNNSATQVNWDYFTDDHPNETRIGVMPGSTQPGFGFVSLDLPGIVAVRLEGETPIQQGYEDEGPDSEDSAIVPQLDQIEQNDFVSRNAAAPMVAVPTPFNATMLLDRIQTQTHTWIAMQLLDAALSTQLDRYLTAAANAYRLNQPKAGKEHIQTLRKMLKKEHEDSDRDDDKEDGKHEDKGDDKAKRMQIDRLAARVLDFDLKYVLKRMGDD